MKSFLQQLTRKFTNVRAGMVTRLRKQRAEDANFSHHDPIRCFDTLNKLAQSLVSLKSDNAPNGRDLFNAFYDKEIKALAKDNTTITNSAGAYQAAAKDLWAVANQEEWNEKAAQSVDVYE